MSAEETSHQSAARNRRYWLRLLSLIVIGVVGASVVVPFASGFISLWGLTHPGCYPGTNPGGFNPAFEDINFPSTNGLTLKGYFIPGTNGATIITPPAYSSGRGAQLDDARILNEGGFNVLTFDARVCASQNWISLGYQEVEDVQAAYRYLQTRSDIDLKRVGLHGFSSAGATVIMAATRMPEIRSITSEGGYHDYPTTLGVGEPASVFIQLYRFGALAGYRAVTGDDMHVLSPISVIDKIAPRPLLLVYGSLEVSLPGAQAMLERARETGVNADLWIVDGADHGTYYQVAPEEFVKRVVGFHLTALLTPNS